MNQYILDDVNVSMSEAELETSFMMVEYYAKQSKIEQYYDYDVEEVYQEGLKEAWESDTSAFKGREDESVIVKILKFIPRLLRNILKWIWSKLKQFWNWLTGGSKKKEKEQNTNSNTPSTPSTPSAPNYNMYSAPIGPPAPFNLSSDMTEQILANINNGEFDSLFTASLNGNISGSRLVDFDNPSYEAPKGMSDNLRVRGADGKLHNTKEQIQKSAQRQEQIHAVEKSMPKNPGKAPDFETEEKRAIAVGIVTGEFKDLKIANPVFMKALENTMKHLGEYVSRIAVKATGSANANRNTKQFLTQTNTFASQMQVDNRELQQTSKHAQSIKLTLDQFYDRINRTREYIGKCGNYLDQMTKAFDDTSTLAGSIYSDFKSKMNANAKHLDTLEKISEAKKSGKRVSYKKMKQNGENISGNIETVRADVESDNTTQQWVDDFMNSCTALKNTLKYAMGKLENTCVANRAVTSALRKYNKTSDKGKQRAMLDSGKYNGLLHEQT